VHGRHGRDGSDRSDGAVVQVIIGIELLPPTTGFTVWQHVMFH
jgi:hypothetical protein